MTEHRDPSGYSNALKAFNQMLNADFSTPGLLEHFEQFGTHGYALGVTEEHIAFLQALNSQLTPVSKAFDPEMIRRWETLNELLVHAYRLPAPIPQRLLNEFSGFAALVAFPLLEEVARRVSNMWDEDGILSIDIPESFGLFRITSKGVREPKSFKKGQRIVDLAHKLFAMKSVLSERFQRSIESLDRRMSVSRVEGIEAPHVTFFERVEFLRNLWLHGRRFDGIEAWLVTHFLALLYFRIPQSEEDRNAAEAWARGYQKAEWVNQH